MVLRNPVRNSTRGILHSARTLRHSQLGACTRASAVLWFWTALGPATVTPGFLSLRHRKGTLVARGSRAGSFSTAAAMHLIFVHSNECNIVGTKHTCYVRSILYTRWAGPTGSRQRHFLGCTALRCAACLTTDDQTHQRAPSASWSKVPRVRWRIQGIHRSSACHPRLAHQAQRAP